MFADFRLSDQSVGDESGIVLVVYVSPGLEHQEGIALVRSPSGHDEVVEASNALTTALDAATRSAAMAAKRSGCVGPFVEDSWPRLPASSLHPSGVVSHQGTIRPRRRPPPRADVLARALRAEGLTGREMAAVFGVSHQRISELLSRTARSADAGGRPSPAAPARSVPGRRILVAAPWPAAGQLTDMTRGGRVVAAGAGAASHHPATDRPFAGPVLWPEPRGT